MNSEPAASPRHSSWRVVIVLAGLATLAATGAVLTRSPASAPTTASQAATTGAQVAGAEFNDSHFHLTNYVQKGIDVRHYPGPSTRSATSGRPSGVS